MTSAPSTAPDRPDARSGHRAELHGLRGLAIGLVVVYHVFLDRVSGGVDVFLFLSAFFLTGSFVRRMEDGRPLAPVAYWARTFKRLLPPAVVVVLGTLAAVRLLLPPSTWIPSLQDAVASLLQVQNWHLIRRGTDYEAAATLMTSPMQQFWSMSIQGQVFLLWPLLFVLCALLARAAGVSPRRAVLVLMAVVAAGSFAWSVLSTATQQPVAYFDTTARMWEFAAGSLLALWPAAAGPGAGSGGSLPVRARIVLGWAGLAVLVGTGIVLDARSLFPGWIALVPLLGATGVFLAGTTGSRWGADRLLASRPFSVLGDISYSLYLIHWPLLTVVLLATGRERTGALTGALVVVVSLVLAWLLTRLVDTPVRRWRWANAAPLRSWAVAGLALLLGLGPALGAQVAIERSAEEAERRAVADNPGARVLDPEHRPHPDADPDAPPLPTAGTVRSDWAALEEPCAGELAPTEGFLEDSCTMTEAPEDAPVLLVVGNSRVAQNAMALVEPAREHGWRLVVVRGPSCVFTPGIATYKGPECDAHNDAAMEYIGRVAPEAVVVSTTLLPKGAQPERVSPVTEETVPALLADGVDVVALRETPRLRADPIACLEDGGSAADCTEGLDREIMPRERTDAATLEELAGSGEGRVYPLDLLPVVCPEEECPPLIGNVHVMFDQDHTTATYMSSAGWAADRELTEAGFPW